jgi:tetrahydromethanopterin S-methyltransferase subunit G
MPADVTREEFHALEQEVEGEKLVTRHILEQSRRNGDDLAAVKTRLDRVEEKVDRIDKKVDRLDGRLGHVETGVRSLRTDIPKIVADTMREVLREQKGKP